MIFFDTILRNHNLNKCPKHLWQIKVRDDEYAQLKEVLAQETRLLGRMPFASVARECALFFAEYWRREYIDGPHRIDDIFAALPHANRFLNRMNLVNEFYKAAQSGAKKLNLKIETVNSDRILDSLLYQGGLPMARIMKEQTSSGWNNFVKGLVNKNYDFDNLHLSTVASQSLSMRDFCDQIWEAIDGTPDDMPFSVENEAYNWYQALVSQFKTERIRQRKEHPFSLDWIFNVDHIGKKVKIVFFLKGSQKLTKQFAEQEHLESQNFFTATVSKEGKIVNTFDYYQKDKKNNPIWFCNRAIESRHIYRNGETVSLILHNNEFPHISESLDLETPHLLFLQKDGNYALGNRIGREESFLLIPEGWNIVGGKFTTEDYQWDDISLKGVRIPAGQTDCIQVEGADGTITFGYNEELYWTEISSSPLYDYPNIVENVYDTKKVKFSLCRDGIECAVKSSCTLVEYRVKHEKKWTPTPKYGEVFARAKQRDGKYVTPVRLLNIGEGLEINIIREEAKADNCKLQVRWPHGKVVCQCGEKCGDDTWLIKKADCNDARKIPFLFVPKENPNSQFSLNIKAPFREFFLIDDNGHRVENGCYIPFQDLSKYQYHIVGDVVRGIQFGGAKNEFGWFDEKLHIKGDEEPTSRIIPYEGSLATLFGSRKVLKEMLDKTSKGLPDALIPAVIKKTDGNEIRLTIKEFPFNAVQDNENIHVKKRGCRFYDRLRVFCIDKPTENPMIISANDDGDFTLPANTCSWGKILVTADSQGRLLPSMADVTRNLTYMTRRNERRENIDRIVEELKDANMADESWRKVFGWFGNSQKYDIPASSLLDLVAVGCNANSLIRFAFNLYIDVFTQVNDNDDEDTLIQKLQGIANELAIQWFWLLPEIHKGIEPIVQNFTDFETIKLIFCKWVINQNAPELFGGIEQGEPFMKALCMPVIYNLFETWLKRLCYASVHDVYSDENIKGCENYIDWLINKPKSICHIESKSQGFVNENQSELDGDVKEFFAKYEQDEVGSLNERWMKARVAAVHAHLIGKINLLEQMEEVRRSVIFCYKSSTLLFMESLNNKLSKENYI